MRKLAFPLAAAVALLTTAGGVAVLVSPHTFSSWKDLPRWIDDAGTSIAPLVITPALCLWAAVKHRGWRRASWLCLGAFALTWGIGEVIYTYFDLILNSIPFPSLADAFFLGAVPIGLTGLLLLPGRPASVADIGRQLLDGLLIGASILFVSWTFAFNYLFSHPAYSAVYKNVLGLAYPATDVVMATVAVIAFLRMRGLRLVPVLLTIGICLLAAADTNFNFQADQPAPPGNTPLDFGWYLGYWTVGLAAIWAGLHPSRTTDVKKDLQPSLAQILTPYAVVALAVAAAIYALITRTFSVFHGIDGVVIVCLMMVRQMTVLRENVKLNRSLERMVQLRTAELEIIASELRVEKVNVERSEERMRALVEHSSDVIVITDPKLHIDYVSNPIRDVLKHQPSDVLHTPFDELIHPEDRSGLLASIQEVRDTPDQTLTAPCRMRMSDGHWRSIEVHITNMLKSDAVGGLVFNLHDVSEQAALEQQLVHQAFHDSLTGLPNRALFIDRVHHEIDRQRRRDKHSLGVIFLDLDGFKTINDSLGHRVGDQVLVDVARRVLDNVRPGDTVARMGADEFAVLLEDLVDVAEANGVAQRIVDAMRQPVMSDGQPLVIGLSVGVATPVTGNETPSDLLQYADLAMHRAKEGDSNTIELFQPKLQSLARERVETERELRIAIEDEQLTLYYQPILELNSRRVIGLEALVRWVHPERGLIPPLDFIPLAEHTGLIIPLGTWVLRTACAEVKRWQQENPDYEHLGISVNLSALQLRDPGLIREVAMVLKDTDLDPADLTLEVTESMLVENVSLSASKLMALRQLGVKVALDDFGTGYSSLSYLRQMPLDTIKIDRSFVLDINEDETSSAVAHSIVALAQALNLGVVAEGIENTLQLAGLLKMGCNRGQGFHFAKPIPQPDVAAALTAMQTDAPARPHAIKRRNHK